MKPVFLHLTYGPDGLVTAEGEPSYYHGNAVTMSDGSRNGVYAEWDWDGATLRAGNCRYGMSPLFYYCGEREICISNSIPAMLARGVPDDWDDDAMAVFIRRHTFLGEDTPFRHIRATPPGAKLTWRDGKMTLERSDITPKPQHLKRAEIIDGIIELFRQAIARRLPDNEDFYLPLTGGKDSRHILLELNRQGVRPKACVTASMPPPLNSGDSAIAAQLAERLNLPHIILPASRNFVADEQRKNLRTNFCTLDHGWSLPLVDFLQDNAELSYDGLGLDVFFNTIWYSDLRAKLFSDCSFEALSLDFLGNPETALSLILSQDALKRFDRDRSVARMTKELHLQKQMIHPVASFQFWSRTRRTTSSFTFGLQSVVPLVHTPFLDNDLFDFVSSIPATVMRQRPLHVDVIKQAYTKNADLKYAQKPTTHIQQEIRRKSFFLLINLFRKTKSENLISKKNVAPIILKSFFLGKSNNLDWINPELLIFSQQVKNLNSEISTIF